MQIELRVSIEKYIDQPSKVCVKIVNMNNPKFSFSFVSFEQTLDEINELKASQATDMLVPIIKGNKDVLAVFTYHNVSNCL